MMLTGLTADDIVPVQGQLADSLYRQIPAGGGGTGAIALDAAEKDAMLTGGARRTVERGWGEARDLKAAEKDIVLLRTPPQEARMPQLRAIADMLNYQVEGCGTVGRAPQLFGRVGN